MSLSVEQINKLQEDNERLRKEAAQWKHEYEMLDAVCEISKMVLSVQKQIFKEIKRIILTRKTPYLSVAGCNRVLDLINKPNFNYKQYPNAMNKEDRQAID